jgi:arginine utilization regulatory protein
LKLNRGRLTISRDAVAKLEAHNWPGNVRELEHLVERMVALSTKDHLGVADVPELASSADPTNIATLTLDRADTVDMIGVLADVEARMVRWALERSNGNLARAADMLGMPRSTLQYRVSKLGDAASARTDEEKGENGGVSHDFSI